MKTIYLLAAAALTLAACTKNEPISKPATREQPQVEIAFVGAPSFSTRAFFDPTASTESWEKSLQNLTVLVFSPAGNLLVERRFTPEELTARTATFAMPNTAAGTECEFYAIANYPVTGIADKAALLALMEETPGDYNSTFAQVSTTANRPQGFVMCGTATARIAPQGETTPVALTLERTVAKVAVQAELSAQFALRYPGKVLIRSARLSKAARSSYLIGQSAPAATAMDFAHEQASEPRQKAFCNLFYVYENPALADDNRLLLELSATYDRDGDFSTTYDQAPVSYTVPLSGNGDGSFTRNGYYRVAVAIDGLTGSDITASVTVADWITPVTQHISLGD